MGLQQLRVITMQATARLVALLFFFITRMLLLRAIAMAGFFAFLRRFGASRAGIEVHAARKKNRGYDAKESNFQPARH